MTGFIEVPESTSQSQAEPVLHRRIVLVWNNNRRVRLVRVGLVTPPFRIRRGCSAASGAAYINDSRIEASGSRLILLRIRRGAAAARGAAHIDKNRTE